MAQKFGLTWWGEQWLKALARIDFSNRLPRGATYARKGAVLNIAVSSNLISAKVQGSRKTPYKVSIIVPKFSQKEIDLLIDSVIENPTLLAQLMNRELSPQVMDVARTIGLQIFPTSWKDLDMHCSCPDWAVPCKHLAAVIYMMSREIDNNPFLIFALHGVDFQTEFARRGISVDTATDLAVPEWKTLFTTRKTKPKQTENSPFQRIDLSRLPSLTEPLCHLLAPNPPFYPQSDFQNIYLAQMQKLSRQAERILSGKKNFVELTHTDALPVLRTDSITFVIAENGLICPTLSRTNEHVGTILPEEDEIPVSVLAIPADYIADFDPTVAAMHQALMAALHLLYKGCIVPQIVAIPQQHYIIRWLPALLDEEVKRMVESLARLIPPDMVRFRTPGDSKDAYVEEPAVPVLSWAVTWFVSMLSENCFGNKVLEMFFIDNEQAFQGVGEKEIPGGIKAWLDRLHLSTGEHRTTLIVSECDEGFSLDLTVSLKGKDVPLREILTQKKHESDRFPILKELSLLIPFVKGLEPYINEKAKRPILFSLKTFAPFLTEIIPAMRLLGVRVVLPKSMQTLIRPRPSVKISRKKEADAGFLRLDDLLEFDWRVALGDQLVSKEEFMKLMRNADGLIRFKNQYIYVQEGDLERLQKAFAAERELAPNQLLQAALSESYDSAAVELSAEARKLIRELTEQAETPVPKTINATLRPYQERGFSWMYRNMRIGFGSILADDMGLGKTLQVITLLQKMKDDGLLTAKTAAAVVVPTGLITNWQEEVARFAPELSVFVYHGQQRDIKRFKADILLTTYGVVRSDVALLKKRKWQVVVIDEAQNIKNAETAQSKAVRSLPATTHIAMSGTPVENRLSEFWSVMDFANKGYLGNPKYFQDHFARPIQSNGDLETTERFRKVTAPFLMRRLKTDKRIISDLPDKIEQNEAVYLTEGQASLYERTLHEAMKEIEGIESTDSKSLFKRQGLVLQMILALKQICNHPALFLKNGEVAPELSGKTVLLLDLLQSIVESNQKVLVFTQFKEMGELLATMIAQRLGERPLFLHGGCSVKERKALVDRFQSERGGQVFLLSLKAAGTGLNLTAASHVIHYDLWWNPAVEAQATDRAYRIGQHQNVLVHRFITRNTFEERINEMIQRKKGLAELTVATGESWIGKLSNKELHEIFERE